MGPPMPRASRTRRIKPLRAGSRGRDELPCWAAADRPRQLGGLRAQRGRHLCAAARDRTRRQRAQGPCRGAARARQCSLPEPFQLVRSGSQRDRVAAPNGRIALRPARRGLQRLQGKRSAARAVADRPLRPRRPRGQTHPADSGAPHLQQRRRQIHLRSRRSARGRPQRKRSSTTCTSTGSTTSSRKTSPAARRHTTRRCRSRPSCNPRWRMFTANNL